MTFKIQKRVARLFKGSGGRDGHPKISEFSFRRQTGMPSGPVTLVLINFANFLLTDISDTWNGCVFSIAHWYVIISFRR